MRTTVLLALALAGCSARPGARQSFKAAAAAALDAEWARYDEPARLVVRLLSGRTDAAEALRMLRVSEPIRRADWERRQTGIEPDWGKVTAEMMQIMQIVLREESKTSTTPR